MLAELPLQLQEKLLSLPFVKTYLQTKNLPQLLTDLESFTPKSGITIQDITYLKEVLLLESQIKTALHTHITQSMIYVRGGVIEKLHEGMLIPVHAQAQIHIEDTPALHNFHSKTLLWEKHYPHLKGWPSVVTNIQHTLQRNEKRSHKLFTNALDHTRPLGDMLIDKVATPVERALLAKWCFEQRHMITWFVLGCRNQISAPYLVLLFSHRYYVLDQEKQIEVMRPVHALHKNELVSGNDSYSLLRLKEHRLP